MSSATRLPANQIKEGMYLDLEGDTYACFFNENMLNGCTSEAVRRMREDHESLTSSFAHEYQFVEAVEHETEDCVRIDCVNTSFGCPPDHKINVIDMDKE